jgi:hypothetical protein
VSVGVAFTHVKVALVAVILPAVMTGLVGLKHDAKVVKLQNEAQSEFNGHTTRT